MNPTTTALTAVLSSIALAACGSSGKGSDSASGGASQPAAPVAIAIQDFKFKPAALTVKAGTRLTWSNSDAAPHTATAGGTLKFDTGTLEKGGRKTIVLVKSGTYSYLCAFHPFMKGTVTVTG